MLAGTQIWRECITNFWRKVSFRNYGINMVVTLEYANDIHFYHYCCILYMHMQRDGLSCELRFVKDLTLETLNSLFWRTGDPVDGNINGFYMSRVLIRM